MRIRIDNDWALTLRGYDHSVQKSTYAGNRGLTCPFPKFTEYKISSGMIWGRSLSISDFIRIIYNDIL